MKCIVLTSIVSCFLLSTASAATSYDGFRWFQIEVSIFSNEFPEYRNSEFWSSERLNLAYPDNIREFAELSDFLQIDNLESKLFNDPISARLNSVSTSRDTDEQAALERLNVSLVGPFPANAQGDMRLPDLEREAYLLLPEFLSDFQTTNARLERSVNNRLLFKGLWRQPVVGANQAMALVIQGGELYGNHHELEGSITIRFNQNQDRVVIDTNLWLSEFTRDSVNQDWKLPPANDADREDSSTQQESGFNISGIVQMQQSRDMRSTEFHYLDHPSMGLVITVFPYDLPPVARTFSNNLQDLPE